MKRRNMQILVGRHRKACMLYLLLVWMVVNGVQSQSTCFPAIFNFGDDDGDTGGMHASFPNFTAADLPPYGSTYFGVPQGRNSDGRLIIDFITQAYGMRNLDPYLQSVTSDFSQGVNFATWGAVARTVNFLSPFPLHTQVQQFQLFQKGVFDILNQSSALLASKGLLKSFNVMGQWNLSRENPYKKMHKDLLSRATVNGTTIQGLDNDIHIALGAAGRLPLPEYFNQGLYFISIGTNDLKLGIANNQTLDQIRQDFPNIVTVITTAIQDLYNAGARNLIVAGVGNIGCFPAQLVVINHTPADLDNWGCLTDYNTLARDYNVLLQQYLVNVTTQLPLAKITYLDIYQMQHNLLFNSSNNGMTEIIKACCGLPSQYNYSPQVVCGERADIANVILQTSTCAYPSEYVVWDGIHYTDAANRYFANQIFSGQFFNPPFALTGVGCTINPF